MIAKLRRDIDTIDARYLDEINKLLMLKEDVHSTAQRTFSNWLQVQVRYDEMKKRHDHQQVEVDEKTLMVNRLIKLQDDQQMIEEDLSCQVMYLKENLQQAHSTIHQQESAIKALQQQVQDGAKQIQRVTTALAQNERASQQKDEEITQLKQENEQLEMTAYTKSKQLKEEIQTLKAKVEELAKALEEKSKVVKVETAETEAQTDIDMEAFDRLLAQGMRKTESKESRGSVESKRASQNSQRVGGGGSISGKPPKNPSQGAATSQQDLSLNVQGKSANGSGKSGSENGEQRVLPNLLK